VFGTSTVVRGGEIDDSTSGGPGSSEFVSFITPAQGTYGIIVTMKAGSSNLALTVS